MKIPPTLFTQKILANLFFLITKWKLQNTSWIFIRPTIMANNNLSMKEGS
jgi:hypothetical protein